MTIAGIVARRRKCAMTTRGEILCAAWRRFLAENYENVGLRDIARDAGVDVALVSRYFGSKEALFREVLRGRDGSPFGPGIAAADLPDYLVSLMTRRDECGGREHVDKLLIILRSASSPAAAEIVREAVRGDVLEPLAAILGGPDSTQRAGMVLAILFGTTVLQTIMAMEPLDACDDPDVRRRLARLFETALA
jgi:AcrR family transcriptional regulator